MHRYFEPMLLSMDEWNSDIETHQL